jgi:flagellar biosynthesis component FlhA
VDIAEIQFGVTLLCGTIEKSAEWEEKCNQWIRWFATNPGLLLREVKAISDKGLGDGDFRFRINDVTLPTLNSATADCAVALASTLRLNAGSFLAAPLVHHLLQRSDYDTLLPQVVEKRLEPTPVRWTVCAILRNLLDEFVPIRDLRAVLESLLFANEMEHPDGRIRVVYFRTPTDTLILADGKGLKQLTIGELTACARFAIRTLAICYSIPVPLGVKLIAFYFAPEIESRLLAAVANGLTDYEITQLRLAVLNTFAGIDPAEKFAIVVSQPIRSLVHELIGREFPTVGVVGLYELPPNLREIVWVDVINWKLADPQAVAGATGPA